LISFV